MEVKCSRLFNKTIHVQNPSGFTVDEPPLNYYFFFFWRTNNNKTLCLQQSKQSEWFHISVTLVTEIKGSSTRMKTIFSSSTSFQEYLRPYGSTENNRNAVIHIPGL